MYRTREAAGRLLAEELSPYRGTDAVVLALPRGGVPVGHEVARALGLPLDVIVVRKVGVPFQPELAAEALGEGGVRVVNERLMRHLGLTDAQLASAAGRVRAELEAQLHRLRAVRRPERLAGRTAILVDDGVATGATARAACEIVRARGAAYVVVAVPVAATRALEGLRTVADEVVCLASPTWFTAVGEAYDDFAQVTDDEVMRLLRLAASDRDATQTRLTTDVEVEVPVAGASLHGHLTIPEAVVGLVVFVHGSGSSRRSPRNRAVAKALNRERLATLLFDLLTEGEEHRRELVFDVDLLAARLTEVIAWCRQRPACADLPLGLFGASTGAAAALVAAARSELDVRAVVSRGGRPDLAGHALGRVGAPTLLIVGGRDTRVLQLNREAQRHLTAPHDLLVVPGATHLFEQPEALEDVAVAAADWFLDHLPMPPVRAD